jgi:hypothetical protein
MILDAGPLISADRNRRALAALMAAALEFDAVLRTTDAVVAQVWRSSRQSNLAAALATIDVRPEFGNGREIGQLLAATKSDDPTDASLAVLGARIGEQVLTSDVDDLTRLATVTGCQVVTWRG